MKVANLINNVSALTNNLVTDGVLIDYINVLEDMVFREIIKEFRETWLDVSGEDDLIHFPFNRFEIKSAVIYNKERDNRIDEIKWLDDNINLEIFSDVEQTGSKYSIKNKWGDCAIKVVYRYTPEEKTLENMGIDDLDIIRYGLTWYSIYEHYLKAMAFFSVEEYGQYNNETVLYNEDLTRLKKYIYDNYYNPTISEVEGRWK